MSELQVYIWCLIVLTASCVGFLVGYYYEK
jgi:hypothetical protein